MTRNLSGLALALAFGALSVLAAPSASAQVCSFVCTCSVSCSQVCRNGPFVQDCPECNMTTCGEYGDCAENCGECTNNPWTTTVHGTNGGDTLTGTSANELFYGYDGADTIYGNAGDDTVLAGYGNDTVYGGSGDDCMFGESGNDHLDGETGSADYADGGVGTDTCYAETEVNCEL